MSLDNELVQIWVELPGKDYEETLQATPLANSLFQIREIPFIVDHVNYMDIVRCQESAETPRAVTKVVQPSGYTTIHLMFAENTPNETIAKCIRVLRQEGATYRRSGLRAFSINVPPEANKSHISEYLAQLQQSGILSEESRDGIGAAEQSLRHLDYLMGKRPVLQDGHRPETELDLGGSEQLETV